MMKKQLWSVAILVGILGTLVFGVYALVKARALHASAARTTSAVELIPQPAEWVSFVADVRVTHAENDVKVYGRFFRDAHGCGRLETGPLGEIAVIYIHNIPRSEYYWWTKRTSEWVAGPMKLPEGGWRPMPRRANTLGLLRRPLFVEIRSGRTYDLRAKSGFTAYTQVNLSGTFSLQIPELNFFEVVKETLEGRREVYSNVALGDQPEEIFELPSGGRIRTTTMLGGTVAGPADDSIAEHMNKIIAESNK